MTYILLLLLLLCAYSRMRRGHERRSLGALLLVSRSAPASTDSLLKSGCGEARRLRSRIVVVFVVRRIDPYAYVGVYLALLLYQALLSNLVTSLRQQAKK